MTRGRSDEERAAIAERQDRVAAMTRCGISASDIAACLRITKRTVTRDRRAAGCNVSGPGIPLTEAEIARAAELLADGCSYHEVARTLGRGPKAIKHRFPGLSWTPHQISAHAATIRNLNRLKAHA